MAGGFLFGVCSKCCEEGGECGTNCQQTVSVSVSVAGYATTLNFTAAAGFASYSDPNPPGVFDYFLVSAFLSCALVDGVPTWTLSVTVCWKNGADEGSEDLEGTAAADGSGCPEVGAIDMNVTFGNGDAIVTASIA